MNLIKTISVDIAISSRTLAKSVCRGVHGFPDLHTNRSGNDLSPVVYANIIDYYMRFRMHRNVMRFAYLTSYQFSDISSSRAIISNVTDSYDLRGIEIA